MLKKNKKTAEEIEDPIVWVGVEEALTTQVQVASQSLGTEVVEQIEEEEER